MATRLKMVFTTAIGKATHSYSYANPDVTTGAISALAAATITNGDIFAQKPLALESATIVTTTETNVTPTPNG